jgi:hypothetical protein
MRGNVSIATESLKLLRGYNWPPRSCKVEKNSEAVLYREPPLLKN